MPGLSLLLSTLVILGGGAEATGVKRVLDRPAAESLPGVSTFVDEFKALDAALTERCDGRKYSSEGLAFLEDSPPLVLRSAGRGVTSLREWLSHWSEEFPGLRCWSSDLFGLADFTPRDVSEGEERAARSLEPKAVQARVAALLGPSPAGRDLRAGLEGLSLDLPNLRVVLIVCFSGLGEDRRVLSSLAGASGDTGLATEGVLARDSPLANVPLTTAASEDVRSGSGGRGNRLGRESSA
jgi:hypothetical protein